jgi:hypothetical protein
LGIVNREWASARRRRGGLFFLKIKGGKVLNVKDFYIRRIQTPIEIYVELIDKYYAL